VPKDAARAARLYCDGARAGDAEAQFNLGWMYANGRGIERDDARAAYFFNLAAKQGICSRSNMLRLLGEPTAEVPECMRTLLLPVDEGQDALLPNNEAQKKVHGLVHQLAPQYGSARVWRWR
jgi:TPR repeat protein